MHAGDSKIGWIDVSVSLRSGMVRWPDNPPVRIERALNIEHGDTANVSEISMGAHTGTHMDGPLHFIREGKGLDEMPLDATIGRARVIEISDPADASADTGRAGFCLEPLHHWGQGRGDFCSDRVWARGDNPLT